MTHIACTLTRRLAPLLAPALLVAALGCREDAQSPTAPEPGPAVNSTAVIALSFRQVSAGVGHTCGVTTDNLAYCWGRNFGSLGDGTTTDRLTPVAVAGGLRFRQVTAGRGHNCGVTTDDLAYCWGLNDSGQLGDGTTTTRLTPVAVAGGRRFLRVSAGDLHTCAVNPFDVAFCWGNNRFSQLGDNTTTQHLAPVRVVGGLRFRQVTAGAFGLRPGPHTCGVTTGNLGYCWGRNDDGQLGDGTLKIRRRPTAVAGAM
jgi:hypothetical protein